MPVEDFNSKLEILISVYQDGYIKALNRINDLALKGRDTKHAKAILRQIKAEMKQIDEFATAWVEEYVPKAYKDGYDNAFSMYASKDGMKSVLNLDNFSQLHGQAIEVLSSNLHSSLIDATQRIGREATDIFRKVQLEAAQNKALLGESVNYTKNEIIEKLQKQGITAFKDRRGSQWALDTYAKMAARTIISQAVTLGTINRAIENGFDLILVSEHHPTCEICAPLAGKVFSISGETKGYPIWRNYIPAHPNCRHDVGIYQPKFDDQLEYRKDYSNKSLTIDNRPKSEAKAYNDMQDRNRQLRNDRNQYRRYKMLLPDNTPGNFGAFTRMKYSNSKNWKELQSLYKSIMSSKDIFRKLNIN